MTKRSIFAKIFLITFALFSSLVIFLHASVYFIFPSTYIESQRQTILKKSQALAKSFQGQEEGTIESVIDLYSKTNDIKVSIKGKEKQNALEVKDDLLVNPDSQNNSLVIEERKIQTKEGKDLTLQFLATVDSQKEARDISLGFLPYSLLASFVLSLIASYLYARRFPPPPFLARWAKTFLAILEEIVPSSMMAIISTKFSGVNSICSSVLPSAFKN